MIRTKLPEHSELSSRKPSRPAAGSALALVLLLLTVVAPLAGAAAVIDLSGPWRFALDRADAGIDEGWHRRVLSNEIQLPGLLQAQGYGDPISADTPWVLSLYDQNWHLRAPYQAHASAPEVKVPFLAQPPRHYLGAAWYQRDIDIPTEWDGRRIVLLLERPRWKTTVWVNEREVGSDLSLVAPHEFDLGLLPAGRHRLTVRCDNRMQMDYRPDAHAVSDSLGSSWNGIAGAIELRATPPVWIDDLQVFPDFDRRQIAVELNLGNATGGPVPGASLVIAHEGFAGVDMHDFEVPGDGRSIRLEIGLDANAPRWSEFEPNLNHLSVELTTGSGTDAQRVAFGLRDFRAEGNKFILNGREVHLRGTHNGGDFPLTGHPPTDVESWRKIFGTCKEWGINHVRFHSWCPPEAAFVAADELGLYLQPECGMWNYIDPGSEMEAMMYAETERMIRAYGNHPSFVLFSPSNEPRGQGWKESLPKWVAHFREVDPRRLYTTGTGWSLIDDPGPVADRVDFLAVHRIGPRRMRGEVGFHGRDYSSPMIGVDVPNIVHENGQWVGYPDFGVMEKFTGYMRPGNYAIFRDSLANKGMLDRNADFAWASGRFQLESYKEEIEANLRTANLSGFQLLDLHDYLGQGTALVGVLDAFWEEKSYVGADEWGRFCSETVPLARFSRRLFTSDESLEVPVEFYHFGAAALTGVAPSWRVLDSAGKIGAAGAWPSRDIPIGNGTTLDPVSIDLMQLEAPGAYRFVVGIPGTNVENDWRFWVYPPANAAARAPQDVHVTDSWPDAAGRLAGGGKVLFTVPSSLLDWTSPPLDTVPAFWNKLMGPAWTRMLGIWVDEDHPALAGFPTSDFGDWQWIAVAGNSRAINLDRLPGGLQPFIQPIDDWNRNYKLGLAFECSVGAGKLIVTSLELDDPENPAARQLRQSLLDYMAGDAFDPPVALNDWEIRNLLFDSRVMSRLGASAEGGRNAGAAIDGNPNTFWTAGGFNRRSGDAQSHPHELIITFPDPVAAFGFVYMPRQNERHHQGDVRAFSIAVSEDGETWTEARRGELLSTYEPQTIHFDGVFVARWWKFVAESGFGGDRTAAVAEFALLVDDPAALEAGPGSDTSDLPRGRTATEEIDQ